MNKGRMPQVIFWSAVLAAALVGIVYALFQGLAWPALSSSVSGGLGTSEAGGAFESMPDSQSQTWPNAEGPAEGLPPAEPAAPKEPVPPEGEQPGAAQPPSIRETVGAEKERLPGGMSPPDKKAPPAKPAAPKPPAEPKGPKPGLDEPPGLKDPVSEVKNAQAQLPAGPLGRIHDQRSCVNAQRPVKTIRGL